MSIYKTPKSGLLSEPRVGGRTVFSGLSLLSVLVGVISVLGARYMGTLIEVNFELYITACLAVLATTAFGLGASVYGLITGYAASTTLTKAVFLFGATLCSYVLLSAAYAFVVVP